MDEWKHMVDMADKAMREGVDFTSGYVREVNEADYKAGLRRAVEVIEAEVRQFESEGIVLRPTTLTLLDRIKGVLAREIDL